jgi:hypothetical protein
LRDRGPSEKIVKGYQVGKGELRNCVEEKQVPGPRFPDPVELGASATVCGQTAAERA